MPLLMYDFSSWSNVTYSLAPSNSPLFLNRDSCTCWGQMLFICFFFPQEKRKTNLSSTTTVNVFIFGNYSCLQFSFNQFMLLAWLYPVHTSSNLLKQVNRRSHSTLIEAHGMHVSPSSEVNLATTEPQFFRPRYYFPMAFFNVFLRNPFDQLQKKLLIRPLKVNGV